MAAVEVRPEPLFPDVRRAVFGAISTFTPMRQLHVPLRRQADAAAKIERRNAARSGRPYQGQVGHVPDTALTGIAHPPAGWLDMPGKSNSVIGGGLSSRIGQPVGVITVDGKVP